MSDYFTYSPHNEPDISVNGNCRHADELTRQRIAEAFNLEAIPPFQPPQPALQQNIPPPITTGVNRPVAPEYSKEKEVRPVAEVPAMHHPTMPQQHVPHQQPSPRAFHDMKGREEVRVRQATIYTVWISDKWKTNVHGNNSSNSSNQSPETVPYSGYHVYC